MIIACITKRSDNHKLEQCHFVESRDERLSSNLADPICHSFKFYADIGVTGRVLSPLSLKCASYEHRGSVSNTLDYQFPPFELGCRGTTKQHNGAGTLFSLSHLRHFYTKTQTTAGNREMAFRTIRSYLYLREALGSRRSNLAHPNFATFSHSTQTKGLKGPFLSSLSQKCASNEHRGSVKDKLDFHFRPSELGCRGTTQWLPGVGTLFDLSHLRNL